jgi:hypothetical protein
VGLEVILRQGAADGEEPGAGERTQHRYAASCSAAKRCLASQRSIHSERRIIAERRSTSRQHPPQRVEAELDGGYYGAAHEWMHVWPVGDDVGGSGVLDLVDRQASTDERNRSAGTGSASLRSDEYSRQR